MGCDAAFAPVVFGLSGARLLAGSTVVLVGNRIKSNGSELIVGFVINFSNADSGLKFACIGYPRSGRMVCVSARVSGRRLGHELSGMLRRYPSRCGSELGFFGVVSRSSGFGTLAAVYGACLPRMVVVSRITSFIAGVGSVRRSGVLLHGLYGN